MVEKKVLKDKVMYCVSYHNVFSLSSGAPHHCPTCHNGAGVINIFPLSVEVLEGHWKMKGVSLTDSSVFFSIFSYETH